MPPNILDLCTHNSSAITAEKFYPPSQDSEDFSARNSPEPNSSNSASSFTGSLSSLESLTMAATAMIEQHPPPKPMPVITRNITQNITHSIIRPSAHQQLHQYHNKYPLSTGINPPQLPSISQMLPDHFPRLPHSFSAGSVIAPPPQLIPVAIPAIAVPSNVSNFSKRRASIPPTYTVQSFKLNRQVTGSIGDNLRNVNAALGIDDEASPQTIRQQQQQQPRNNYLNPSLCYEPQSKPVILDPAVQACIAAGRKQIGEKVEVAVVAEDGLMKDELPADESPYARGPGNASAQISLNFRNFALSLGPRSTNLTSNQYGSAASDKGYYGAVMTDSVLCSSISLLEAFAGEYRPTVNNKLKALKFMEFLQERLRLHFCGKQSIQAQMSQWSKNVELAVAFKMPEALKGQYGHCGDFHVLRRGRHVGLLVYKRSGRRAFPVEAADIASFFPFNNGKQSQGMPCASAVLNGIEDGDFVFVIKGTAHTLDACDAMARQIASLPLGCDLEHIAAEYTNEAAGVLLGVVGNRFDEFFSLKDHQLRHIVHTERKGQLAIDQPWSYAITKHSFLLRPYLAMIYSDASKINRFTPTVEYIVRKACGSGVGSCLNAQLRKLSEIQHMAGALLLPGNRLRFWGTGGACLVIVDRGDEKNRGDWSVSYPGIANAQSWSNDSLSLPVGEVNYRVGDLIFMLCPSVRSTWTQAELSALLSRPNYTIPDKLSAIVSRFGDERAFRSGVGAFEIIGGDRLILK